MSTLHDGTNPSNLQLVMGLAKQFECPPAVALSWLTQMFVHFDPKAMAERLAGYRPNSEGIFEYD